MTALKTVFGIDFRTLATFRIGLGFCVLIDLASRARDLSDHYSDLGVLPLGDLAALGQSAASLHLLSGSTWFQVVLFLAAAIAAVCLIFGFWTRLATVVSWGLLLSLIGRNKLLVHGGDNLLLLLLFWGMFLPLGARCSIDAALNRLSPPTSNHWSMATTAVMLQVAAVFFFTALLKSGPEWIPDGTAIAYVVQLDYFARPFGVWLGNFPSVTRGVTWLVWYLELLAPLLIFSPIWFPQLRWAMLVMLLGLQIGIVVTLNVGLFPLIASVGLIVFLPSAAWTFADRRFERPRRGELTIHYDGDCSFCRKVCLILQNVLGVRDARIVPAQTDAEMHRIMKEQHTWIVSDAHGRRHLRWDGLTVLIDHSPFAWMGGLMGRPLMRRGGNAGYRFIVARRARLGSIAEILAPYHSGTVILGREMNVVVGMLMLYMLFINIQSLPVMGPVWSQRFGSIGGVLGMVQRWDMFTPAPPKYNVWWVVRGELSNGTIVDVLKGTWGEPDWGPPVDFTHTYPTYRWEKFLSRLALGRYQSHRPSYARYLCRQWNESHGGFAPLLRLWLHVATETNQLDGRLPQRETLLLLVYDCASGSLD